MQVLCKSEVALSGVYLQIQFFSPLYPNHKFFSLGQLFCQVWKLNWKKVKGALHFIFPWTIFRPGREDEEWMKETKHKHYHCIVSSNNVMTAVNNTLKQALIANASALFSIPFPIHFQGSYREFVNHQEPCTFWSFPLFSWLKVFIQGWYCKEKLEPCYS